ncbi:hypothetical protein JDV02_010384 [Purpureocillium takamizusanense]|uniref:Ubiquitin-like domain-containing protein n=1 Tax=Purpureocillium takamizusanense TaxID=2060973 RepID=A0A9Q8QUD1_9HYPO|nr:uncharacterized protein JDV02_010384 [Purpureocillium takamizusanense]UNI24652.1 hypothetical protein JDV02_010384 [Purpureocillium takamizusanense]
MTSAPLHLTIRFSTSIPDLDLDIPTPHLTTVLSLKHLLRTRLSTPNRLRLIHQGRILPDTSALSAVLKPLPPPPPPLASSASAKRSAHDDGHGSAGKDKGKAVEGAAPPPLRIYVNCSIGDELSDADLAAEAAAAHNPPSDPSTGDGSKTQGGMPSSNGAATASGTDAGAGSSSWRTRPRPRGFDRLLQAGFTSSEISTLRTQFASINSERFAPDAMPSPDTLRGLEDAWIDSNAGEVPSLGAGAAGGATIEDELSSMSSVLDILIRGMMIGFFFPLGSLTWLLRQGVWSDKWQIFVGSGVVLSLTVGIVMGISGER